MTESTGPEPAAGPVIEGERFSFNLPQGWMDVTDPGTNSVEGMRPPSADDSSAIGVLTTSVRDGAYKDVRDYAGAAGTWQNFKVFSGEARRRPFREWAGEPAYHYIATDAAVAGYAEQLGILLDGHVVTINFDFDTRDKPGQWTPAARQAVIESVEASWEWK